MEDAQTSADQHQEDAIFGRSAQSGNQARITAKRNPGGIDGSLVMRAADDGARAVRAHEPKRGLDIGDCCAAGCGFDAPRDERLARHGAHGKNIDRSCDRRIAGGYFTNGKALRCLRCIVSDDERIADENRSELAAFERDGGFDGDFRADTVGVADGERDRRR